MAWTPPASDLVAPTPGWGTPSPANVGGMPGAPVSGRLDILHQELSQTTDPTLQASLNREIAQVGGQQVPSSLPPGPAATSFSPPPQQRQQPNTQTGQWTPPSSDLVPPTTQATPKSTMERLGEWFASVPRSVAEGTAALGSKALGSIVATGLENATSLSNTLDKLSGQTPDPNRPSPEKTYAQTMSDMSYEPSTKGGQSFENGVGTIAKYTGIPYVVGSVRDFVKGITGSDTLGHDAEQVVGWYLPKVVGKGVGAASDALDQIASKPFGTPGVPGRELNSPGYSPGSEPPAASPSSGVANLNQPPQWNLPMANGKPVPSTSPQPVLPNDLMTRLNSLPLDKHLENAYSVGALAANVTAAMHGHAGGVIGAGSNLNRIMSNLGYTIPELNQAAPYAATGVRPSKITVNPAGTQGIPPAKIKEFGDIVNQSNVDLSNK